MSVVVLSEDDLRRILREELRALAIPVAAPADRRVTYSDAASSAGVSVATIRAWRKAGRLHAFGEGRNTRFSLSEVLGVSALPAAAKLTPGQKAEQLYRRAHG